MYLVKGVNIFFFFLHFYAFQSILSRLRYTVFFENFREREARNARDRSEQDASAKPEGAKRPSSPAGLAGRSAERACKLVVKKKRIDHNSVKYLVTNHLCKSKVSNGT